MSPFNGYVYIAVINVMSTLIAYYGLTVLRAALRPELERQFSVTGKILSLQLTLLCSAIPNIVIGILVATDVIACSALFPSKARGEGMHKKVCAASPVMATEITSEAEKASLVRCTKILTDVSMRIDSMVSE